MTKKCIHILMLGACCFAMDSLQSSSAESKSCLSLRDLCETPAILHMVYGPPPYCYVWKGYGHDEEAYKTCVRENSRYSCRQACFVAKGDGKCEGSCDLKKGTAPKKGTPAKN